MPRLNHIPDLVQPPAPQPDMSYCGHDMPRATCTFCTAKPPAVPQRPRISMGLGRWFEARFPGECGGCGEHVSSGDSIRADGEGGYLCSVCGDVAE